MQATSTWTRSPWRMIGLHHRVCRLWAMLAVMVMVVGCASTGMVSHGISTETEQPGAKVYDIQIDYGTKQIKSPGAGNNSGIYNATMPIADSMTVQWTVNGVRKSVNIDLRDKVPRDKPLENWRLLFTGEQVELWREVLVAPPATPTGLRPRAREKVYP